MPNPEFSVNIEDLRRNYTFGSLTKQKLPANPTHLFAEWFAQLQDLHLPDWFEINAMIVSTVNARGGPSSRTLLLKGFDDEGFRFFTNYDSDKGNQIAVQPQVSLCFLWPMLERQVRIEGVASKTSEALSDEYFVRNRGPVSLVRRFRINRK